ncbi:MAG: hypothetical protein II447_02745 [Bacteroidaceae bacterium]|nr:hypothetical protein [Bacteroidaceae bacterium]
MKKYITYRNKSMWLMMMAVLFSVAFIACSDDNSSTGAPVITGVKVLSSDTLSYDYNKTYTKAGAGNMIAIMGENLGGALHVYVNNQALNINPTMNTNTSIIVTIPSEDNGFKLTGLYGGTDIIRVVTRGGEATYGFKVTGGSPSLKRIDAEYPRETGDTIYLTGDNLFDIEQIYITDAMPAALDTVDWENEQAPGNHLVISDTTTTVMSRYFDEDTNNYKMDSRVRVVLPAQLPDSGSIVVKCASGNAYLPFSILPGKPTITSVSNDMPMIDEEIVISGTEFYLVESVSWGDVTVTEDDGDLSISKTHDKIFVVFDRKPSPGSEATLKVNTASGTATYKNFYERSTILTTFDGDAIDNGWGPNATFKDSKTSDGIYAYFNIETEYQQWWGTMIYFRKDWDGNKFPLPSYDVIPANASTDDVYLAMNVFDNGSDYNNGKFSGFLRYFLQYDNEDALGPKDDSGNDNPADKVNVYDNGFRWDDYNAGTFLFDRPVLADYEGKTYTDVWYRHVVPLSSFLKYKGHDYQFVYENGINQFRIQSINQGTSSGTIDFMIDNVRIIYIPKTK